MEKSTDDKALSYFSRFLHFAEISGLKALSTPRLRSEWQGKSAIWITHLSISKIYKEMEQEMLDLKKEIFVLRQNGSSKSDSHF